MNELQKNEHLQHNISLIGRKSLNIDGVKEMISFDEQSVHMLTAAGELTVEGEGLHVKVLDVEQGLVTVEGRVDGINYLSEEAMPRRGLWARISGR